MKSFKWIWVLFFFLLSCSDSDESGEGTDNQNNMNNEVNGSDSRTGDSQTGSQNGENESTDGENGGGDTLGGDSDSLDTSTLDTSTGTQVETDTESDSEQVVLSPYKGIGNSPAFALAQYNVSWCYNWMSYPQESDCHDPLFVPMIWGARNIGDMERVAQDGYTTVLGFNEPNKADQANMTVDEAIALWPQIEAYPHIRVGSPAVSGDGRAWFEDFMQKAEENSLRIDFVAIHWYGWNAGSCDNANQLENHINWASQYGKPIWITEWGCMHQSNPDTQTVERFFTASLEMLENHPHVERYAWYPWLTHNGLMQDGNLTPLGELFSAAPAYR